MCGVQHIDTCVCCASRFKNSFFSLNIPAFTLILKDCCDICLKTCWFPCLCSCFFFWPEKSFELLFFSFCLYSKLSNCLLVGLCPMHRNEHRLEMFSKTPTGTQIMNQVDIWQICQNKAHETGIISSYQISPTHRISKWNRIRNRHETERNDAVHNLGHWFGPFLMIFLIFSLA